MGVPQPGGERQVPLAHAQHRARHRPGECRVGGAAAAHSPYREGARLGLVEGEQVQQFTGPAFAYEVPHQAQPQRQRVEHGRVDLVGELVGVRDEGAPVLLVAVGQRLHEVPEVVGEHMRLVPPFVGGVAVLVEEGADAQHVRDPVLDAADDGAAGGEEPGRSRQW